MGLFYTIAVGVVAYLIGSINSSILISKAVMGKDIRESGSGNAGATNMLRTMGKKYAIITLVIDILKGVVALLLAMLAIKFGAYAVSMYIAGVAVVVGHNFPVFFGFKGGKGVATSLGVILLLDWKIGLITLVIALAIMAVSKYVSLGSVMAALVFVIIQIVVMIATDSFDITRFICVVILGGLLIIRHRANIKRLLNGTENKGNDVYMWSWKQEETDRLNRDRENKEFLPGIKFPQNIICSHDMSECIDGAEVIVTAVPSPATRTTAKQMSGFVSDGQKIVNLSKGLEGDLRLSEVYKEEIPQADISVLSGPSHAEEVSRRIPTTVVVASGKTETAEFLQDVFMTDAFRVYTSDDIIGVELGGALKNVIALCAGISDGLGYGDNTKAALITRGVAEISRLGVAMGANIYTFAGLSGLGDLIVTATSTLSRNYTAGELIGKGMDLNTVLTKVHMVVEGVNTATAAYGLGKKYGVETPIIEQAYNVLYNGVDPRDAVNTLMTRDKKSE